MGLDPELERRIQAFGNPVEQGSGFSIRDWIALVALGVLLPIGILAWGWPW